MPVIYPATVYIIGFLVATVLTLIFVWFNRKGKLQSPPSFAVLFFAAIGFWLLTLIAAVLILNPLIYKQQVAAALPFIQQALNDECGENRVEADEDGFSSSSTYQWSSVAASCYYNNMNWVCSCSS